MGSLGSDSGYPGLQVMLTDNWDSESLADKDILNIDVSEVLVSEILAKKLNVPLEEYAKYVKE